MTVTMKNSTISKVTKIFITKNFLGGIYQLEKTKKWIAFVLVCSQLLSALPAAAETIVTDDSQDTSLTEEQTHETSETESSTTEETTTESQENEAEEVPSVPEESQDMPEDTPNPTPIPEGSTSTDTSDEGDSSTPTPDTGQSSTQESNSENKSNNSDINNQSSNPGKAATTDSTTTPIQITPTKDTWDFIKEVGESARTVGLREDLYASVMIAQAILESGSGKSQLSIAPYYNIFGIKGTYKGKGVTFKTQEDDGSGNLYTIDATFRQYDGYEDTFNDYAKLLKEGLTYDNDFYRGTWKSETKTYTDATAYLTGRYATDTQYGEKLNALIEAYSLTEYDKNKTSLQTGTEEMIYPISNPIVSSPFGERWGDFHRGVDFAVNLGTPVYASLSGKVIRSEFHPSWGNYIAIEHANGLTTLYAHANQNLVTVGQTVEQGEIIASSGSTGNSTGPHLHFEVCLSSDLAQDHLIDPMTVLPK